MEIGYRRRKEWKKICSKCGHNHVNMIGDAGTNKDELMYELMNECCGGGFNSCNCEEFKE